MTQRGGTQGSAGNIMSFLGDVLRKPKPRQQNNNNGSNDTVVAGGNGNGNNGNNTDVLDDDGEDKPFDQNLGIWDEPQDTTQGGGGGNNSGNNNQNGNNGNNGGADQPFDFEKFIDAKGMGSGFKISDEDAAKLHAGDFSVVPKIMMQGIQQAAKDAYRHAMIDAGRIMDTKLKEGIDTAVERSNGSRRASETVNYMNSQLPYTADKDIKPVADAMLSQQIKIGKSPQQAVEIIKKFFAKTAGLTVNHLEDNGPAGSGGFRGGRDGGGNGRQSVEDTDWFEALSGGNGQTR